MNTVNKKRPADKDFVRIRIPMNKFNVKQKRLLDMAIKESGKSQGAIFGEIVSMGANLFFNGKRSDNPKKGKAVSK